MTQESLEQLELAEIAKRDGIEPYGWPWSAVKEDDWPTQRARDFAHTLTGLRAYLEAGQAAQVLDEFRSARSVRVIQRTIHYLSDQNLTDYTPHARHVTARPKPDADEIIVHRAMRAADRMRGGVGGYLGESLSMLAGMNIVLRDVHLLNIGWRVHECVELDGQEDCAEAGSIVIFDPGHTPTEHRTEIEERMIANARWRP